MQISLNIVHVYMYTKIIEMHPNASVEPLIRERQTYIHLSPLYLLSLSPIYLHAKHLRRQSGAP